MDGIKICNMALSMLGLPGITSFYDNSNHARQCNTFFPALRDQLLRDHHWSFATNSAELAQLAETPFDSNYSYVCALPPDLILILSLDDPDAEYRPAGKKILVNHLPAKVIYIRRVEDSEDFDELFADALRYRLAAELCMANTRDAQMIQYYQHEYEKRLATAKAVDSQENIQSFQPGAAQSNFIAARSGRVGRSARYGIKAVAGTHGVQ